MSKEMNEMTDQEMEDYLNGCSELYLAGLLAGMEAAERIRDREEAKTNGN